MSNQTEAPVIESEDAILGYVHGQQKKVVEHFLGGEQMKDPELAKVGLQALRDMQGAALTRKRIKTEERAVDGQKGAVDMWAKLLGMIPSGTPELPTTSTRAAPQLGADIPRPELADGELSGGSTDDSIEKFSDRTGFSTGAA